MSKKLVLLLPKNIRNTKNKKFFIKTLDNRLKLCYDILCIITLECIKK